MFSFQSCQKFVNLNISFSRRKQGIKSRSFIRTVMSSGPALARNSAGEDQGSGPHIYFGTMTFAWSQSSSPVDDAVATDMIKRFRASGGTRIDTARIYAGGNTEPMLGRALQSLRSTSSNDDHKFLGSKAHPTSPGGLGNEGLRTQLAASCAACDVRSMAEFYLHQPDTEHSLAESLETAHMLVEEGLVGAIGLSNYHASEVDRCVELCKANRWTIPTVYQGLYNPLNRLVEEELLPVLQKHGIAFVAYNPLAAGLLTGKHQGKEDVVSGRFKNNPNYMPRFYTDSNHQAVEAIQAACTRHGLGM
ncbi:hypothetical protein CYMTET_15512, partial [Cymbomonas tetramitiformis]